MAFAETRELDLILKLRDQASKDLSSFGKKLSGFGMELNFIKKAADTAKYAIAGMGAGLVATGVMAIKSASDYEQNRIAFEGMLGSAEKAKTLLADITKLGTETPFELPQLVTASKQLLAYGMAQEDVIPKLKMLGDISATVGMDKLPELILAFGQVKAKGKLAGQEMLQFTNTGIGLRDELVKLANKGEGVFGSLKKVEKTSKDGKIVWADLEKAMSKGQISYEMVSEAMENMTREGGIAHDAMIRQSKSLAGLVSNLQDYLGIFLRDLVGMSTEGDIREGSLFFYLKHGAEKLYNFLEENKEKITETFTRYINDAIDKVKAWYESIGGKEGLKQKLLELWETIKNVADKVIEITSFIWEHREAILKTIIVLESLKIAYGLVRIAMAGAAMISAFNKFITKAGESKLAMDILKLSMAALPTAIVISVALAGFALIMKQIKEINDNLGSTESNVKKLEDKARELEGKRQEAKREGNEELADFYKQQILGISGNLRSIGQTLSVNDAVITPRGDVIKTDPRDYLIATKNPAALAGGGVTVNINGGYYLDRNAGEKLAEALSETLRRKLRL